jgi:hypothetical protein
MFSKWNYKTETTGFMQCPSSNKAMEIGFKWKSWWMEPDINKRIFPVWYYLGSYLNVNGEKSIYISYRHVMESVLYKQNHYDMYMLIALTYCPYYAMTTKQTNFFIYVKDRHIRFVQRCVLHTISIHILYLFSVVLNGVL